MKYLSFELTMPNVGSWDGKWHSAHKKHFLIKRIREVEYEQITDVIFKEGNRNNWHYNFGDGWGANVHLQIVDAAIAKKRTKETSGFCGYEWMVDSIIKNGKIFIESEQKKENAA